MISKQKKTKMKAQKRRAKIERKRAIAEAKARANEIKIAALINKATLAKTRARIIDGKRNASYREKLSAKLEKIAIKEMKIKQKLSAKKSARKSKKQRKLKK